MPPVARSPSSRIVAASTSSPPRAIRFAYAGHLDTRMKEASDVAPLPGDRFFVVGDTKVQGAIVGSRGVLANVRLHGIDKPSELEGVAYDPHGKMLFVAREEHREIVRYAWDAQDPHDLPTVDARIALHGVDGPRNKGIEGLAFLSAQHSPTGRAQLLLAHEGKPREILVADADGTGKLRAVHLDGALLAACRDFSAIAVDPHTGDVFVGSDESSSVAQLRLVKDGHTLRAHLVGSFVVRDAAGDPLARIEGLAFDASGHLHVLTENTGLLHRLARQGS